MAGTAARLSITFADGNTEDVRLTPRILMLVERKYEGKIPPLEGTLYGAWLAMGRPGGNFDAWTESVDDAAPKEDEGEADPFPEGASSDQ